MRSTRCRIDKRRFETTPSSPHLLGRCEELDAIVESFRQAQATVGSLASRRSAPDSFGEPGLALHGRISKGAKLSKT
jgi:hypothetical protein